MLFGATIFSSACLLFLVQPLVSKLILPWFGGSAALWITCLLFFQAGLLLGYLYAHALAHRVSAKHQALIHIVLLVGGLAALPILPNASWQPQPGQDPTWLVIGVLSTSVGLPYFLLAATTPLLQSWYARPHQGTLPYRYFALSNAGSLLALLAYPVLIEPNLTGTQQARLWSIAFGIFVILCSGTALLGSSWRAEEPPEKASRAGTVQIVLWSSLAASASMLLLAVTNLLTQNIAPMPLLWVLPLVIPAIGALAAASGTLDAAKISLVLPLCCAALFVCCMTCHGELARSKPSA
ncbi:MAG: hypothetical protein JO091_13555, partial [Acidobacteriaceae bacterium]|nr:hypothetical protein [Acidobacteriaceae bacterium]